MNSECRKFVEYILSEAPKYNKQSVIDDIMSRFGLIKDRSVYHNDYFAVRFCYSKSASGSFSNTVLSLSALEKYDKIPFFVVLVRKNADNLILLANSTFLKKVSHSSQRLSMNNIKGSFNGADIIRNLYSLDNIPENFDTLFSFHQGLDWKDNLARLVDASSKIKPINEKFIPSAQERANILASVKKASDFVASENFAVLESDLNERCNKNYAEILIASHIENTNIRGRLIESLITSDDEIREKLLENMQNMEMALPTYDTKNGLGDYFREFNNGDTYTDIKTKVIYLDSNPKAFNIDKFLKQMSDGKSVFLFFFIGIDRKSIVKTLLCSVYHEKLIDNTILQFHWAGRTTRGVAQFKGKAIDEILHEKAFRNNIDDVKSSEFLIKLLDR